MNWFKPLKVIGVLVGLIILFVLLFGIFTSGLWQRYPRPIPTGPAYYFLTSQQGTATAFNPIEIEPIPNHPYMAPNGKNNMHGDSYVSDTYTWGGPLGNSIQMYSRAFGMVGGECASVNFDQTGRLITVCSDFTGVYLVLLEPWTLELLAQYAIPQRESTASGDIRKIVKDTSGGAYFYLDHEDRAVLATADMKIKVIGLVSEEHVPRFKLVKEFDLSYIRLFPNHSNDTLITTLPDWNGRYWFVTRLGIVGVVDSFKETIATHSLVDGEEIQNSFAVDAEGVYIVSSHAMYAFRYDQESNTIVQLWREIYDRGTRTKPGMIHQGSGTSPTLLGEHYLAIGDQADGRMNILVYKRQAHIEGDRMHCSIPVFTEHSSTTENTLIGFDHSIIVENNYGYDIFPTMMFGKTSAAGIVRVDFDDEGSCWQVWESSEISQNTVPKLSLENGLIYLYTKAPGMPLGIDAYYLTTLDFETGETVYKKLTGTGVLYDNNWAPITIGSDGTLYVGMLNGILAIRDGTGNSGDNLIVWIIYRTYFLPLLGSLLVVLLMVWIISKRRQKRKNNN